MTKFGLSEQEYQFILHEVVAPLSDAGATVHCFGSRARGDHARYADLDLLVTTAHEDLHRAIGEISERLEESNFPYKVDLALENELAEGYREDIIADRVRF